MNTTRSVSLDALLLEERRRKAREQVDLLLLEGLNSGPAVEWTKEDWDDLRREVRKQLKDTLPAVRDCD